jgi:hypothetical protein
MLLDFLKNNNFVNILNIIFYFFNKKKLKKNLGKKKKDKERNL